MWQYVLSLANNASYTDQNPVVVPHGVAYEEFKAASDQVPPETRISESSIAFMFESSRPFTITDYAFNSPKLHEHEPKMWDNLVDNFAQYEKETEEISAKGSGYY